MNVKNDPYKNLKGFKQESFGTRNKGDVLSVSYLFPFLLLLKRALKKCYHDILVMAKVTKEEYIKLIKTLNHSESLIVYTKKGCLTMCCNGELLKTRKELRELEGLDGNYFEVQFTPFNMLDIRREKIKYTFVK